MRIKSRDMVQIAAFAAIIAVSAGDIVMMPIAVLVYSPAGSRPSFV